MSFIQYRYKVPSLAVLPLLNQQSCFNFSAVGYGSGVGGGGVVVSAVAGVITGAAMVVDSEAGWGFVYSEILPGCWNTH